MCLRDIEPARRHHAGHINGEDLSILRLLISSLHLVLVCCVCKIMATVPQVRRVAVIGVDPASIIATDALAKEQAFDVVRVFDRRPIIGGTWVYTPHLPAAIPSLPLLLAER
ncbi:uncharacterized protein QC761_0028550 [Podospora bellae-mahoneyi]|uniref:Uncharacterized protein n=1 Tax=Podospora bellae-mahoneyi TaxID=2093777 RepID=A0ABR0FU53_9PEZI|nr:hypothetical protein QC761_0028550 [Podospora bellae-mahoneyi]